MRVNFYWPRRNPRVVAVCIVDQIGAGRKAFYGCYGWKAAIAPISLPRQGSSRVGWIVDFAVWLVADMFGDAVAKNKPWWLQLLASLGCLAALGLFAAAFWLLWIFIRP